MKAWPFGKTKREAQEYAQEIANLRAQAVCVFPVAKGTHAYEAGYRFGTCLASERADYERDGACVVEVIEPAVAS